MWYKSKVSTSHLQQKTTTTRNGFTVGSHLSKLQLPEHVRRRNRRNLTLACTVNQFGTFHSARVWYQYVAVVHRSFIITRLVTACKLMYVHTIHDQSDDIITKQQCMQKTGNCCVNVRINHIKRGLWTAKHLGQFCRPCCYCGQSSTHFNHSWTISNGKVELCNCKLHPKRKEKNIMNEWMLRNATKVHVYVQCFSLFFQAWEDLLKFDTTAGYSYHSSIFS